MEEMITIPLKVLMAYSVFVMFGFAICDCIFAYLFKIMEDLTEKRRERIKKKKEINKDNV